MTIDEAITLARAEADLQRIYAKEMREITRDFPLDYGEAEEKRAEEHEQLAEWLEELKAYRNVGVPILQYFHDEDIYNKAIDDFSHELKETLNSEIPLNYSSSIPFFTLENARKLVDDVSEQLKDGGGE